MNWNKAKTILIIFFLCTDLFLLATLLISTQKTSIITDDIVESTITILNNNRIYIDPELIPRKTHNIPMLQSYNIISDYDSFSKLLAGEDAAKTGADMYSGSNGNVSFKGDKFDFIAKKSLFSDMTNKINTENAQQTAHNILKNYNFDDNGLIFNTEEKSGNYIVTVTKEKDSLYFFNCKIELVLNHSGLKRISGSWFFQTKSKSEKITLKSVAGVLIDYISLSNRPSSEEHITSLNLGYSILEEDIYHHEALLSPCWKITLNDDSEYILNAAETQIIN